MNRYGTLLRALLLALALSGQHAFAAKAPNFVILLSDDLGWADLTCYGSSFYETPNLDQLAREGVRFSHFYSAGSVCSPTRSSIMTGKYPARTGITDWIPGQQVTGRKLVQLHPPRQLALEEVTFAEALKEGGYQTAYVGKWHLGGKGFQPNNQGFDLCEADEAGGDDSGGDRAAHLKKRLESTDRFTSASLKFLRDRDPGKPFLLFLAYHDVHTPIQPMPGLVESYEKKAAALKGETPRKPEHEGQTRMRQDDPAYASMVSAVDQSAGKIRQELKSLGLADNTIIIFTSDNGGLSTTRNIGPTCNSPLRAGKGWLYEGGIRVPLIMSGPGVEKRSSALNAPLITCDFYPTLLELAGLPLRPQQHLDGASFARLLKGGQPPAKRAFFWHYPHYHGSTWTPGAAVQDEKWKLIEFYESGTAELYNLEEDPSETTDIAARHPEKVRALLSELHAWQKNVGARIPEPSGPVDETTQKKKKKAARKTLE